MPKKTQNQEEPKNEKTEREHNKSELPKKTEKPEEKNNTKLIIGLIAIIMLGIFFIQSTGTDQPSSSKSVQIGDTVYITYTERYENGTIISTNDPESAKEIGLELNTYTPLSFTIGQNEVLSGLEEAIIGMRLKDKKTITLTPDKAYGEYSSELIAKADRVQEFNRMVTVERYETLSSATFQTIFDKRVAILSDEVTTDVTTWNYTITDVKPDNITVHAIIEEGKLYSLPDEAWNATAIEISDKEAIFRLEPEIGSTVYTQIGPATVSATDDKIIYTINPEIGDYYVIDNLQARVIDFDDETITFDANHLLADQTIIFDIELLQISRPKQE